MAYAKDNNGIVQVYHTLPQQWVFTTDAKEESHTDDAGNKITHRQFTVGMYTGNFADMPAWIHKAEGFMPFYDNPVYYDPKLFILCEDGFEITEDYIKRKYTLTPISKEVIEAKEAEVIAGAWAAIRTARTKLLKETDWTQLGDSNYAEKWKPYRQSLRDITESYESPDAVIWPVKPE